MSFNPPSRWTLRRDAIRAVDRFIVPINPQAQINANEDQDPGFADQHVEQPVGLHGNYMF